MKVSRCVVVMTAVVAMWLAVLVAPRLRVAEPAGVRPLELTVDGTPRTALVYVPKTMPESGGKVPLVFVFHGHGGKSAAALGEFAFDRHWPAAISVYPQGLNIPSITDPKGDRAGWQHTPGEVGDRDLHFFDALLARLKLDYPVDPARVYCTGHSNGGGFTQLLWLARGEVFAAVAPCSCAAKFSAQLPPKPAMYSGGLNDPIVKPDHQQQEAETLRRVNGCAPTGEPWLGGPSTLYPSQGGTPLVTYFYDGGHGMAPGESGLIVKFFQEHPAGSSH